MLKYTIRRILEAIPLVFIVTIIAYLIINLAPGDPVNMFINPETSSPMDVEMIRISLGLDKPLPVRYAIWMKGVLTGDLGVSFQHAEPVSKLIMERLPNTLTLGISAMILSFAVSIPAGIFSAIKRNTWVDYFFSTVAFIGISLPGFWFGLMLILLFSLKLQWLPSGDMRSNFETFELADRLQHLILPTIVLGMGSMAGQMRYMRSSMLEVIRQDYIRTARSKGLAENVVIFGHALRNAMLPIITLMGLVIPGLFSGAVITEQIFSWPGMGRLGIEATFTRDYPLQMGVMLMGAVLVIVGSLAADIGYAIADPRIKYN